MITRQEANLEILKLLLERVKDSPEERFHQMLWNLRIFEHMPGNTMTVRDKYNEESTVTLSTIKSQLRRIEIQCKTKE